MSFKRKCGVCGLRYANLVNCYRVSNSYSIYFCDECGKIVEAVIYKLSKVIQNR